MKQTAVEWFVIELKKLNIEVNFEIEKKAVALFKQAKKMEKAEKAKEYLRGYNDAKYFDKLIEDI